MSKFTILKELADLKSLTRQKLTFARLTILAALVVGAVTFGREGLSYVATLSRMVKSSVRSQVPVEFELERARTMIDDLLPDIKKNMLVIVQEEAGIGKLREEVASGQKQLDAQRVQLVAMRGEVANSGSNYSIGARPATRDEVREELARRFRRYQLAEATIGSKKQLLEAREKSLAAARDKVEQMLNAKRDMVVEVENLQARLNAVQAQSVSRSAVDVDDTKFTRCKQLVDDLQVRLDVADRLLAASGDLEQLLTDSTTVPVKLDIEQQIDDYFSAVGKSRALADSRR